MEGPGPSGEVHRIVDRADDHDAPGAWPWDRDERQRLDVAALHAARLFLGHEGNADDDCWRCEVAPAAGSLGLCTPCLAELRGP